MLIPDPVKTKADVVAVGGGVLAWLKVIPWADVAGLLSCVYLALRIGFYLWDRAKGRKPDE